MGKAKGLDIVSLVKNFGDLTIGESRDVFDKIEQGLFELEQIPVEAYQLNECISGGMYCREITIPKGAAITGRIYKFDHIEMMISGDITIISADGGKERYTGHNIIEAHAGKRQCGLAHEETKWLTVNLIPEHFPLDQALDYSAVFTYEQYQKFHSQLNIADYKYFLNEIGCTDKDIKKISRTDDVVDLPIGYDHISVRDSSISGKGLFTSIEIKKGDLICPVRLKEKRTIAGRYSNHALHSNTQPVVEDGIFFIFATKNIQPDEEITMNYRDTLSFRNNQGDM